MQKVKTGPEQIQKQSNTKRTGQPVEKAASGGAARRLPALQPGLVTRPPNGDPTWVMLWGEDR